MIENVLIIMAVLLLFILLGFFLRHVELRYECIKALKGNLSGPFAGHEWAGRLKSSTVKCIIRIQKTCFHITEKEIFINDGEQYLIASRFR